MHRIFLSAGLFAVTAACSPSDTPASAPVEAPTPPPITEQDSVSAAPVLSYSDAFVMAPIADRDMSMGGVSLTIEGGDARLVGASSTSIDAIELHTMSMTDGTMQMRQVDGFDLIEGETLELKRGGNHLMLFGISEPLIAGEAVDIKLGFETDDGPITLVVEAEVKAVGED